MGVNRFLPSGLRLPGALELPGGRRRRVRAEKRGTWALGIAAVGLGGAVLGSEMARVWKRRSAEIGDDGARADSTVLDVADEVMRDTVAVVAAGYETGSTVENALLNLLASFSATFAVIRVSTHLIRRRGRLGPLRNVVVSGRHIHHFVPGIVLAFGAGGASVLSRNEALDPLLAVPFGVGVALTLDESALLLKLDDVYWTEEGIVSVQITLAATAALSAAVLAQRALRRGERTILAAAPAGT